MIGPSFALAIALIAGPITAEEVAAGLALAPDARDALDRKLNDYPSARFRDVYVTVNGSVVGHRGSYFCGLVNAKNRMGAYTGWTDFVVSGSNVFILGDGVLGSLVSDMCGSDDPRDDTDRTALLISR